MTWFRIWVVLAAVLTAMMFSPSSADAQDRDALSIRPLDTLDAENVRIWLSLERTSTCRVTVTIVNQRRDTVRHVFSEMMSPGYYNLYWDKKDDSGQFVDTGNYRYIYQDCQGTKDGKLKVIYKRWERVCLLHIDQFADSNMIGMEFLENSVVVTLEFENNRGKVIDRPIIDSVFARGYHRFHWQPEKRVPSGNYTVKLHAGDFVAFQKIRFRR
jgi:flagellar hook assembly protein FlgD